MNKRRDAIGRLLKSIALDNVVYFDSAGNITRNKSDANMGFRIRRDGTWEKVDL